MKKFTSILVSAFCALCLVSCGGKNNADEVTIAKHWVGDVTTVRFNINGSLMTATEFNAFLDANPFFKRLLTETAGRDISTYLAVVEQTTINDLTFNKKDGSYEAIVETPRGVKSVFGDWFQVNDVITMQVDLSQAFDIVGSGSLPVTINSLTADKVSLTTTYDIMSKEWSGNQIGVTVDFAGHRASK